MSTYLNVPTFLSTEIRKYARRTAVGIFISDLRNFLIALNLQVLGKTLSLNLMKKY